MAYDQGLAELLRTDLTGERITETQMFGGLCFMLDGHMLCGPHKAGVMFRVGKANMAAALALAGVGPMGFTGRAMTGLVDAQDEAMADDQTRAALLAMAIAFVKSLPAK